MQQQSLFEPETQTPDKKELPRPSRVVLIDGHHLAYRSYFALERLTTSKGEPVQAIFGFIRTVLKLLKEDGHCVIVVFDPPTKTFRHDSFEAYKAGRAPTPDDLPGQIRKIKEIVELMGLQRLESPGYEADDVIGTLAKKAEAQGYDVRIVTGDRDSFQLVSDKVWVWQPDGSIVGPNQVKEKYGVSVEQWVDYRALTGDASDNIPGAKGIGPKGAVKLLADWGSLENLLAHLDEVKPERSKELIRASLEDVRLSYELSKMRTDLDISLDFPACHVREMNRERLREELERLEFGSILRDLNLLEAPKPAEEAPWPPPIGAFLGFTLDRAQPMWAELTGLAAALDGKVYRGPTDLGELRNFAEISALAAKDLAVLAGREGIEVPPGDDPMLLAYLYDPANSEPASTVRRYGAGDLVADPAIHAQAASLLWETLSGRTRDDERLWWLYREVERPLSAVLARMECRGVALDVPYLHELSEELGKEVGYLEAEIHRMAGHSFNLGSRDQLETVLYDELKLTTPGKKTSTGKRSTAASVLEELRNAHPIIEKILQYRELAKLKGTYLDPLPKLIHPKTGRLHTRFNQTIAATGRLSSSDPNLQNIPIRTEIGRRIRQGFVAARGYCLVAADYSQIELRILAHMSGDENLKKVFTEHRDIHTQTAAWMFNIKPEEVDAHRRRAAKCLVEGTRVATGRGWLPIEEVKVGDCVQTDGRMRKVTATLDNGVQPTVRIKTRRGFELRGTPHHRIRVVSRSGAVVWRQLQHLGPGDQVILRRSGTFGRDVSLPPLNPVACTSHKPLNWPDTLDERLARWLGYLVAEGSVIRAKPHRQRYGVVLMGLGRQDPDVLEDVGGLWWEIAGGRLSTAEKPLSVHWSIASTDLAGWVAHWCGATSTHKKIPDFLWQAPAHLQAEFLRGLFEGDGSVSQRSGATYIRFASASPQLAKDVQRMLLSFGVVSSRSVEPRGQHQQSHVLFIGDPSDVQRFAKAIGFVSKRKSQKLNSALGKRDGYAMPYQEQRLRHIYPLLSLRGREKETIYECIRTHAAPVAFNGHRMRRVIGDSAVSEHRLARIWRWWVENDLFAEEVIEAEQAAPAHVYDLSVEGKPAYLAEGFVSHNTINFGVLYGMSAHRLSNELSIPYAEATGFIERYFASYPRVRLWIEKTLAEGRERGYVESMFGRKRFVADLESKNRAIKEAAERMAFNMPVQGTAADLMKLAMVRLQPELERLGAHLLLQVHDEIVAEAPQDRAEEVGEVVRKVMQNVWKLDVPLEVGVGIGENWLEAK